MCANWVLRKDDDVAFAVSVFAEACQRGQVSTGVVWQFRQAVPMRIYREVVSDDPNASWQTLPKEWTVNVREEQRNRKPPPPPPRSLHRLL
jgi:hypothetical protein